MKRTLLIALCFLFGLFIREPFGSELTLFGPRQYVRTTGAPNVYSDGFTGRVGQGRLVVDNGGPDGRSRVSSAVISVNGVQVFGPSDFNQQVGHLEAPVELGLGNALTVELRSKPGSYLTLYIVVMNSAPVANPQHVTTDEGVAASLSLSGSDADGDPLTYSVITVPAHGALTGAPPQLVYIPHAGYNGPDGFTFSVNDGLVDSAPAQVSITVKAVNRPPVAQDDSASTTEGAPVRISVLSNDSDADGDSLAVTSFTQGANGSVSGNGTGALVYTSVMGFFGQDAFSYMVTDGRGGSSGATVIVTVTRIPLKIVITRPTQGSVLDQEPISVLGTVSRGDAAVSVNGIPAAVSGGEFHAQAVPLSPGPNALTALAEDGGETALASVTVSLMNIDLEPLHVEITSLMEEPSTLRISGLVTVTVANRGSGEVKSAYRLLVFEDTNHTGVFEAQDDRALGEVLISSGPAGGGSVDVPVPIVGELLFRDSPFHVFVDSANEQAETDEINNVSSTSQALLDVSASRLHVDQAGCPETVAMTVRVGNSGGVDLSPGIRVAFYDGDPNSGGRPMGMAMTTHALSPGYYEDVVLNWSHPSPGDRALHARADDDGMGKASLRETDRENNATSVQVSICAGPPSPGPQGISGTVTDAVSGRTVSGAQVTLHLRDQETPVAQVTTGDGGWFVFSGLSPASYLLSVAKGGYIPGSRDTVLGPGQTLVRQDVVLSPVLSAEEVRIVLTWGDSPRDLEAHLTSPNPSGCRYHCYYWNREIPGASLDYDMTDGRGPETITIRQRLPGAYRYYVHDWTNRLSSSSQALSRSGAEVRVYRGSGTVPLILRPPSQPGTVWHVFDLDGASGEITPVQRMTHQDLPGEIDFPVIVSVPPATASVGATYSYQAAAADPDADTLIFRLITAPEGMSIDGATGLIQWVPTIQQSGKRPVAVSVSDGRCGEDTQHFQVEVSFRPLANLSVEPCSGVNPGGEVTLSWNTNRADRVVLEPGIGEVTPNGSLRITSPSQPTLWTLTASNSAGDTRARVPMRPRLESFVVQPANILPGGSASLRWRSSCAAACEIDQGIGVVEPEGSRSVNPSVPTTYTLTASNAAGLDWGWATLSMKPAASIAAGGACEWSPGLPVTLSWWSAGATSCVIDHGIGDVELTGTMEVTPASPITYTLTARGLEEVAYATLSIPTPPQIDRFSASRLLLDPGETTTLSWSTRCADTRILTPGIGPVDPSGSLSVTPTASPTTYTLTAANELKSASKTVTVSSYSPNATFSAAPALLKYAGEAATLSWSAEHASSCGIEPGIGSVPLHGSITVYPSQTTTYTLRATGSGGTITRTATVSLLKPTATIQAAPDYIEVGETTTLTWVLANTDASFIEPGIGQVEPGGSVTVAPSWTTTYILTGTGPGGTAVDTVTVLNLAIDYPRHGALLYGQPITVAGRVGDPLAEVTVNGVSAQVGPDGSFQAFGVPLVEGTNVIQAAAQRGGKSAADQVAVTLDSVTCAGSHVPGIYPTIQAAINAVSNGQEIIVCPGTYFESLDFVGKAVKIVSRDGPQATTIRGNGTTPVVKFQRGEGSGSVLSGFTITNGKGGIYINNASPTIEHCVITGNETNLYGGGVYSRYGEPTVRHSTITGNQALAGGGIYCEAGSPNIVQSIVSGNRAQQGGGIYVGSLATVDRVIIRANIAENNGGGIYCSSSPALTNTLIVENEAIGGQGGALYAGWGSNVRMTHCTVAANRSRYYPSGLEFDRCNGTLSNNILWDEGALSVSLEWHVSVTYSDVRSIYDYSSGPGVIHVDPLFVDPANGDYHLQPGSPCIDSGVRQGTPSKDLDGRARPIGPRMDMGAYEHYPGPEVQIISPVNGQLLALEPIRVFGTVNTDDLSVRVNANEVSVLGQGFVLGELPLSIGQNTISALVEDRDGLSSFHEITVTHDPTAIPIVRITSPSHGDTLSGLPISVTGTCSPAVASVTVNGQAALVENGAFNLNGLRLLRGTQDIIARAYDGGGALIGADGLSVTVSSPLAVEITSHPDGGVVNTQTVTVKGWVNDVGASVTLNGTPAHFVEGGAFELPMSLATGLNTLTARAVLASEAVQAAISLYRYVPGSLQVTIEAPANDTTVPLTSPAEVTVQGRVSFIKASVAVNGQPALVGSDGRFSHAYALLLGTNVITVQATVLGDTTRAWVVVFYGQPTPLSILIESPRDGEQVVQSDWVWVSGGVNNPLATVTVNGQSAWTDLNGRFSTGVPIGNGLNLIAATARYGSEIVHQVIRVYVVPITTCAESWGDFPIYVYVPRDGDVVDWDWVRVEGEVDLGQWPAGGDLTVWVNGYQAEVENAHFVQWAWASPGNNEIFVEAAYRYLDQSGEEVWRNAWSRICVTYGVPSGGLDLVILSPSDAEIIRSRQVMVEGVVSSADAQVLVNGLPATVGPSGRFTRLLTLQLGANTITAEASTREGSASRAITVICEPILTLQITSPPDGATVYLPQITVSGQVSDDGAVVTVNGAPASVSNGTFTVQVPLAEGPNPITVAAQLGQQSVTQTLTVSYVAIAPPTVRITSPADGALIRSTKLTVSGTVDDSNAQVTVNGMAATVSNGTFTARDVPLTPGVNTLTAVATNLSGTGTHSVTVTYEQPITLQITSPLPGATITRPDVMVRGTVSNLLGHETGVTVNGVLALVHDGQFVANHVPLEEGENLITATATDDVGNTANANVTIVANTTADYLRISAFPASGISPLETTLRIEASFSFEEAAIRAIGPAEVEFLGSARPGETQVRIDEEGIYYFTVEARDSEGTVHADTVAVKAMSQAQLDALLRSKWEGMKRALASQDIPGAVSFFTQDARSLYNDIFTILYPRLPELVGDMQDIQFMYAEDNMARYRIRKTELYGGQILEITYYIYFFVDKDGVWRIHKY